MKRKSNLYNELYDIDNIINMINKVLSKVKNKKRKIYIIQSRAYY